MIISKYGFMKCILIELREVNVMDHNIVSKMLLY